MQVIVMELFSTFAWNNKNRIKAYNLCFWYAFQKLVIFPMEVFRGRSAALRSAVGPVGFHL